MTTRVSTSQMFQAGQQHIAAARERENQSAERSSSMKEIQHPSENPGGWVQAANLKNEVSMRDSMSKNAMSANHLLTATETIMTQIQEYAQRAHELAIAASSDTNTAKTREMMLSEAQGLYENTLRALNTRYAGRTLLGGFKTATPAVDRSGNYVGDDQPFKLEVSRDLVVPVNVSAHQTLYGEDMKEGLNIPAAFASLVSGLGSNDVDQIRDCLDAFTKTVDQLSVARSRIGARMTQIDQTVEGNAQEKIHDLAVISSIEDADSIKAFSDLTRDQTVLRAAMTTSEKVLKDNPLDLLLK